MKGDNWGEIFMPLMQGNLSTLVVQAGVTDEHALSNVVLRQMLLALECIASHLLLHRGIKPKNILWEYDEIGNYRFCLGDFGSNDLGLARTAIGSEPFMAPEVFHRKPQTTKVDIWSLFAVIVWTRFGEFRRTCSQLRAPEIHTWLTEISKLKEYTNIRGMGSMDPRKRPSATRQLEILDGDVDIYNSTSAAELGDDLISRFSRDLSLQESDSWEMPYYEPYSTETMTGYSGEWAGPSTRYIPPSPDAAESELRHGVSLTSPSSMLVGD
jgi:serine/threonine protein kinase